MEEADKLTDQGRFNVNIGQRKIIAITLLAATIVAIAFVFVVKEQNAQAKLEDWPAFTMVYEKAGPPVRIDGVYQNPMELHRFDFQSKTEWVDTVIDATPFTTDYGVHSRIGSYERLSGRQVTDWSATSDTFTEDTIDEGERLVPNGILVPFMNLVFEQTQDVKISRVVTDALVCFHDQCDTNAEGLLYALEDGTSWVFADDVRGFPLRVGSFAVKELRIKDERRP